MEYSLKISSREETDEFIKLVREKYSKEFGDSFNISTMSYVVTIQRDNKIIGFVCLSGVLWCWYIDAALYPEYVGKNIMKDVMPILLKFINSSKTIDEVSCLTANSKIGKNLNAFGFNREAEFKYTYYFKEDK